METYEKIKALRMESGLTAKQMASLMNTTLSTYYNIENGADLSVSRLMRICQIHKVDYFEYFKEFSTMKMEAESRYKKGKFWMPKGNSNLEVFFREYFTKIIHHTTKLVVNKHASEDIVIETFAKFHNNGIADSPDYSEAAKRAWLYTSVNNAAYNYLKSQTRRRDRSRDVSALYPSVKDYEISAQVIRKELIKKILFSLNDLPEIRREVFRGVFIEGKKPDEVARERGISVNTVRVQYCRALDYIRGKYSQEYEDSRSNPIVLVGPKVYHDGL